MNTNTNNYTKCKQMNRRPLVLSVPVKTRWNSWLKSMKRYIHNHDVLEQTIPNLTLDTEQYFMATEYVKGVKPLDKLVPFLSTRTTTLFQAEIALLKVFNELKGINNGYSNILSQKLQKKVLKRRNNKLFHMLWSLWDPNFFNGEKDVFGVVISRSETIDSVTNIINRLTDVDQETPSENIRHQLLDSVLDGSFEEIGAQLERNSSNIASNATSTLRETVSFDYWKFEETGVLSTTLLKARSFLEAIPPTSIESERSFSELNFILTKRRNSLKDQTVNNIVVVRDFYKLRN